MDPFGDHVVGQDESPITATSSSSPRAAGSVAISRNRSIKANSLSLMRLLIDPRKPAVESPKRRAAPPWRWRPAGR